MTAIVIPICSIRERNKTDLFELLSGMEPDKDKYSKVVACFDSCDEEFIEFFQDKFPWIHSIINPYNLTGFSVNSNRGLRFVRDELKDGCFLVNQDTILPSYEYMSQVVGEGLATPETTNEFPLVQPETIERRQIRDKIAFYCPYFSYNLMKDVGLLDPSLRNLFSDDQYCARLLLHGKYPIEVVNVKIHHKGSHIDSSKPDWESGSGTYNAADLGFELQKYRMQWSAGLTDHNKMIEWILSNHKWQEDMCIK